MTRRHAASVLVAILLSVGTVTSAQNIDPADDGSRYGWGENIGWINLDDAEHYVAVGGGCAADCDGNGLLNILDFVCYQGAFTAGCP